MAKQKHNLEPENLEKDLEENLEENLEETKVKILVNCKHDNMQFKIDEVVELDGDILKTLINFGYAEITK